MRLPKADNAASFLNELVFSSLVTDPALTLRNDEVVLQMGLADFEELIEKSITCALQVMTHRALFELAMDLKREEMISAGVTLFEDAVPQHTNDKVH
jgi:hypothetical protein